jgi:two-component system, NarL family, response regulator LiaR
MVNPIRVFVVDDYAVVRHGLKALIDTVPDMIVIGEAEDGFSAVQKVRALHPDVIVMDLVMPGIDGISAIEAIKQHDPLARILILTNFGEGERVLAALSAGAQGYLLKDAILTDVIEAIRKVYMGKLILHPSVNYVLIQSMQEQHHGSTKTAVSYSPHLTEREQDVIKLVAKGLSNKYIGCFLHINERTVRIHISRILQKLNLENRTQIALYALRHDLASLYD